MQRPIVFVLLLAGLTLGQGTSPTDDLSGLLKDLGSDDFSVRTKATDALRKMGSTAKQALQAAAQDENLERRTRAKLLLQELEIPPDGDDDLGLASRLKRLRPAEPEVEVAPQRTRPDPFVIGPPGLVIPEELKRLMQEMLPTGPEFKFPPSGIQIPSPFTFSWNSGGVGTTRIQVGQETLELERGNRGVELKVTTVTEQGTSVTQTYQAADLQEFREKYPEIYSTHQGTGIFQEPTNGFSFRQRFSPGMLVPRVERAEPLEFPKPTGPILGVIVAEVPASLRAHVDVPERCVMLESITPGSVAETMGLNPWDILTHVDGRAVGSADDIRDILREAQGSAPLEVKIIRRGRSETRSGARPR